MLKMRTRRKLLRAVSAVSAFPSLMILPGCDSSTSETVENQDPTNGSDLDAESDVDIDWLSGGTDRIAAEFPPTSIFTGGETCVVNLTEEIDEGPCYYNVAEREDLSEGLAGLPMQLCFQVIDNNCTPIPGVTVEV